MSAITLEAATEQGLQYMTMPKVEVILDGGRRDISNKVLMLEVRPYRATQPLFTPEPLLVAAYRVAQA
jgi:hypothetical protein